MYNNYPIDMCSPLPPLQATQSVSWVCLDGPLCGEWVECLPELLGHNRTLTLGNGESLVMREGSIKLLFETGSLDHASPACLLNCVSAILH